MEIIEKKFLKVFSYLGTKRKGLISLVLIGTIIVPMVFVIGRLSAINSIDSDLKLQDVVIDQYTLFGYELENSILVNNIGDSNIQLPEINEYVRDVTVYLSNVNRRMLIQIFYASDSHGYSEEYSHLAYVEPGNSAVLLGVGERIITCRIDIGTEIGEQFSIDKIVLNDSGWKILQYYELAVQSLLVLAASVLCVALGIRNLPIEKLYPVVAALLGMAYLFSITPLSVPDEQHHYQSSFELSNYLLLRWDSLEAGESEYFDYAQLAGHYNVSSAYLRVMENGIDRVTQNEVMLIPYPRGLAYFIEYLPQAIGISLGRILNMGFIATFMLGRICNLALYIFLTYCAIRIVPQFKALFFAIAIAPMTLHQAASYSYDPFVIGMSMLVIASILSATLGTGELTKGECRRILIPSVLLAPAKAVYAVLLAMILLIPEQRFGTKRRKIQMTVAFFAVAGCFWLFFNAGVITGIFNPPKDAVNWAGGHNYSFSYIVNNPVDTLVIFRDTLKINALGWLRGALGAFLSGLTLAIPAWIISWYLFALLLSSQNNCNQPYRFTAFQKCFFAGVVLIITLLVMLSMFLGWTSDTWRIIAGVQGRYFIPLLPLLFMTLSNDTVILHKSIDKPVAVLTVGLNMATVNYILQYTLAH